MDRSSSQSAAKTKAPFMDIDPTAQIQTSAGNYTVGDFKWFRCGKCHRAFTTRMEYTKHINMAVCTLNTEQKEEPEEEEEEDDEDEEDEDEDDDDDNFLCRYKCMNCPAVLSSKQAFREHDCTAWLKEDKPNHARDLLSRSSPAGPSLEDVNATIRASNNSWRCDVCNVTLMQKWKYEEHIASFMHKINMSKRGYMPFAEQNVRNFCKICNEQLPDGNKFRHHLNSLAHIVNASKTEVADLASPPLLDLQCDFCDQNKFMTVNEYNMHVWQHQFQALPGEESADKKGEGDKQPQISAVYGNTDPSIANILSSLAAPSEDVPSKSIMDSQSSTVAASKEQSDDPLSQIPLEIKPFSCHICDTACSSLDEYENHMKTHPEYNGEDGVNQDFEEINNIASLFSAASGGSSESSTGEPAAKKSKIDLAGLGLGGASNVVVKTVPMPNANKSGDKSGVKTGGAVKSSMVVSQAELAKILGTLGGNAAGKGGKPKVIMVKGSNLKGVQGGQLSASNLQDLLASAKPVDLDKIVTDPPLSDCSPAEANHTSSPVTAADASSSTSSQASSPSNAIPVSMNDLTSLFGGPNSFAGGGDPSQSAGDMGNFEDIFNAVMTVASNFPELYRSIMSMPEGTKEFVCPRCAASYTNRDLLMVHLSQHSIGRSGPGMYTCSVCKASFKKIELYTEHMKGHVNAMGQPCPHCGRKFMHPSALESHITRQHRRPRYLEKSALKCSYCGLSVTSTTHLQRHLATQHAKEMAKKKRKEMS